MGATKTNCLMPVDDQKLDVIIIIFFLAMSTLKEKKNHEKLQLNHITAQLVS